MIDLVDLLLEIILENISPEWQEALSFRTFNRQASLFLKRFSRLRILYFSRMLQ